MTARSLARATPSSSALYEDPRDPSYTGYGLAPAESSGDPGRAILGSSLARSRITSHRALDNSGRPLCPRSQAARLVLRESTSRHPAEGTRGPEHGKAAHAQALSLRRRPRSSIVRARSWYVLAAENSSSTAGTAVSETPTRSGRPTTHARPGTRSRPNADSSVRPQPPQPAKRIASLRDRSAPDSWRVSASRYGRVVPFKLRRVATRPAAARFGDVAQRSRIHRLGKTWLNQPAGSKATRALWAREVRGLTRRAS